ncbi:MAG: hypothetical protein BWY63_02719 [Chloroflexi bacterium ADurb.Bin360]|nr:MAG: hypothetical protein BWY63_02719 [Chloroflexi bacterium ADurb.Bin360]
MFALVTFGDKGFGFGASGIGDVVSIGASLCGDVGGQGRRCIDEPLHQVGLVTCNAQAGSLECGFEFCDLGAFKSFGNGERAQFPCSEHPGNDISIGLLKVCFPGLTCRASVDLARFEKAREYRCT